MQSGLTQQFIPINFTQNWNKQKWEINTSVTNKRTGRRSYIASKKENQNSEYDTKYYKCIPRFSIAVSVDQH